MRKFINISDLSRELDLINPITKKPLNHVLRYWEKEFKEIKPKKINNRRYYSSEQVRIIKKIKFLLKNKGMTIIGVKKLINSNIKKLDDHKLNGLEASLYKNKLAQKQRYILEKINKIKNYGKKNSS